MDQESHDADVEPEELVQFRRAWRAELREKRGKPQQELSSRLQSDLPQDGVGSFDSPSDLTAVQAYRQAVEYERTGKLEDALRLYRRAFRADPDVYEAYNREQNMAAMLAVAQGDITAQDSTDPNTDTKLGSSSLARLNEGLNALSLARNEHHMGQVTSTALFEIIIHFPLDELSFAPEDEEQPVHIKCLPDEILVLIFRKLDHTGVERFAAVNRKLRIVSLDTIIWKSLVENTYRPPQIPSIHDMGSLLLNLAGDYRRLYIEQPRLRVDGVFISICPYVRDGISDNAWVNINHVVTYRRYLRFYSNGQVLSLLTTDEFTPAQIIPMLKPALRMAGFYIGTWELHGEKLRISNMLDASGKYGHTLPTFTATSLHPADPRYPGSTPTAETNAYQQQQHNATTHHAHAHAHPHHHGAHTNAQCRYMFEMNLHLRSRPLGRWNKLELNKYESVDVATGEKVALPLKNEKPFWFSKVRSYGA